MPVPDGDLNECATSTCTAANHPDLYKIYTIWQIWESVFCSLFCIAFVAGITVTTVLMCQKWMAFLFVLPAACYIEVNERRG